MATCPPSTRPLLKSKGSLFPLECSLLIFNLRIRYCLLVSIRIRWNTTNWESPLRLLMKRESEHTFRLIVHAELASTMWLNLKSVSGWIFLQKFHLSEPSRLQEIKETRTGSRDYFADLWRVDVCQVEPRRPSPNGLPTWHSVLS